MKTHNFKLIDGKFSATEAGKVVQALVSSKINYHSVEKFSNEERFGTDVSQSAKRILALKKMQESLKKVLDTAQENGSKIKMNGFIEITILE